MDWVTFFRFLAVLFLFVTLFSLGRLVRHCSPDGVLICMCSLLLALTFFCLGTSGPIIPCQAKAGDTIQWGGHSLGKSSDWWVFVNTTDPNKFCKVHSHELYNMGNGYKLSQTYKGYLVERP